MKQLKNILLLIGLFSLSYVSMAQTPFAFNVNKNECFTYATTPNTYVLDSVRMITAPSHGTLSDTPAPFTYCPDSNFVGTDTAQVYACVMNAGVVLGCGNFTLTFNVQQICSLQVALVEDSAICIGGNRHFSAVTTNGVSPYTYHWADNTNLNGACEINPGQGNCVTVSDGTGCEANACSNVNGCNLACTIIYGISGTPGSLVANVSGGTQPYSFVWNNGATDSYLFNLASGTYCLTVTDATNCTATACYSILTNGGCYFTYSGTPVNAAVIGFQASNDSNYTAVSWYWDFGDGTTDTGATPIHTYSGSGYYHVSLLTLYTGGDSCMFSDYVYIVNDSLNYPYCQAYFYPAVDNVDTSIFHFTNASVYNITSWRWDFGDNTIDTVNLDPVHNYNAIGRWNVCLTISTANGCSSTYCQEVTNIRVQDVAANVYHLSSITPGFPLNAYLEYHNSGTVVMSGTLVYNYPSGTTYVGADVPPAAHDVTNRLLTFNYSNLVPGTSRCITVNLTVGVSVPMGSVPNDTLWIFPIIGDPTPEDNISVIFDTVVNAWDPNDKAVAPKGEGSPGIVPINTKQLSYHIRFQNTGTAPAQTVQIRDAMNNNIDLTSIRVTNASHAHTTEIIGNELVVTFANINLPDSGADYKASQGFIDVHVKLKPGLAIGTQIFNTANIYFDFNAPVVTNTVVTTLGSVISGIESPVKFEFAVMPNPANSQVLLRGDFEKASAYELINQLGQVVLSGPITSANPAINVSNLNSGIYLMRVKSGTQAGVQRLMIAR